MLTISKSKHQLQNANRVLACMNTPLTLQLLSTHRVSVASTLAGHTYGMLPDVGLNKSTLMLTVPSVWNSQMTLGILKGQTPLRISAVTYGTSEQWQSTVLRTKTFTPSHLCQQWDVLWKCKPHVFWNLKTPKIVALKHADILLRKRTYKSNIKAITSKSKIKAICEKIRVLKNLSYERRYKTFKQDRCPAR